MKIRIEVGEIVLQGLPDEDAALLGRRLEAEVARRVERDLARRTGVAPTSGPRSLEAIRVELAQPPESASGVACEIAGAISRALEI